MTDAKSEKVTHAESDNLTITSHETPLNQEAATPTDESTAELAAKDREIQASLEAIIYAADEPATVDQIAKALDKIQADTGLDIPIHVDGASGGMIAPFLQPKLKWDFRVERVASISTSAQSNRAPGCAGSS